MPLKSDLTLDVSKFLPGSITKKTNDYNEALIKITEGQPMWWEVGAEKYRQMRWNGETALPKPQVLESGKNIKLPSRDSGREIPCRVFQPESGKPSGVFYHIHGGGWVLQSEAFQDTMLKHVADHANVVVLSIGYRLAPEKPFPAGNEDCVDVAEYLIDHAERDYGASLKFMGGDSAGGHLAVVTCYKILETRPKFAFRGLILNFGAYDLSNFLPQAWQFKLPSPLVLDVEIMQHFIRLHTVAYLPNMTMEQRRDPMISPIFADFHKLQLPPALFTCGTSDCLLDDSILMHTKWAGSGAESILKVHPGAAHGFVFFPVGGTEQTEESLANIVMFMEERS